MRQTPAVPYAHSFQLHLESDLFASRMLYGLSLREVIAFSSAHLLAKPSSAEQKRFSWPLAFILLSRAITLTLLAFGWSASINRVVCLGPHLCWSYIPSFDMRLI